MILSSAFCKQKCKNSTNFSLSPSCIALLSCKGTCRNEKNLNRAHTEMKFHVEKFGILICFLGGPHPPLCCKAQNEKRANKMAKPSRNSAWQNHE